jgi:REP element-mobilizing transposase RayT
MARDHLRRLEAAEYRGHAVVHWTMTIRDRRSGWLDARCYHHFRELLTHSLFRYAIACPIFCMMPDHIHLIWMGILESSDQKLAMRHLRTRLNEALSRLGFELQDQPYDHVLRAEERQEAALMATCDYVARNPERAGLVPVDGYAAYPYSGCLVPGYPELIPDRKPPALLVRIH